MVVAISSSILQVMMASEELTVTCLCGAVQRSVLPDTISAAQGLTLCHCTTCRHTSGLLFTSYYPILQPSSLSGLTAYSPPQGCDPETSNTRYFCSVCGCHVFRSTSTPTGTVWAVATGTLVSEPEPGASYRRQAYVSDTGDGGLSIWLRDISSDFGHEASSSAAGSGRFSETQDGLQAACACGGVRFHVTKPDEASRHPKSNFADLLIPYCSTPREVVTNPADEKWWLRPGREDGQRYLAGTCACRSCRLASGFEIQSWAFIPRTNIVFHLLSTGGDGVGDQPSTEEVTQMVLDFDALRPRGILQPYNSSPGVIREFCPRCGATVFWHDAWRPDLIDVSAGLFQSSPTSMGAREESWLDWHTGRVSFAEETGRDRKGGAKARAEQLVEDLERGMKLSGDGT